MTCVLVSIAAACLGPAAADPKAAADELAQRLLRRGPFKATYEITRPSRTRPEETPGRDQTTTVELTADLPWACALVSGVGADEVRAYADARGRMLYVLGREGGKPTLFRTDAAPLVAAVEAVRSAFIAAELAGAAALPGVTEAVAHPPPGVIPAPPRAAAPQGLHLFATLTLGPAREPDGRPYIRSGTGLAVGTTVRCGGWLVDLCTAPASALVETDATYCLSADATSEVTLSRATGLPIHARVEPRPGEAVVLTLKQEEALATFEPPAWATRPDAGVQVRNLTLPDAQRRRAAYTAWIYYVGRCAQTLAGEADWKASIEGKRQRIVEALAQEAAPLWQDRGEGAVRGFVAVLQGAHVEAQRRFAYVKEADRAKARAIARAYALEAIGRRDEMLKAALDTMMERFARALPADDGPGSGRATTHPTAVAVSAELLTLVHQAARAAYVQQTADVIADELTAAREAKGEGHRS